MDILRKIDKRRRELGMSRTALAKRSQVSLSTVNRILSGQHPEAKFSNVLAIADALDIELTSVPRSGCDELRQKQAMNKARRLVRLVQGTSALEGQGLDADELEEMVRHTSRELCVTKRKLWE